MNSDGVVVAPSFGDSTWKAVVHSQTSEIFNRWYIGLFPPYAGRHFYDYEYYYPALSRVATVDTSCRSTEQWCSIERIITPSICPIVGG